MYRGNQHKDYYSFDYQQFKMDIPNVVRAMANVIDIKDYKGDKRAGIKTLPTILGLRVSQRIKAGLAFTLSLASYFFLRELLDWPEYQNLWLFLLLALGLSSLIWKKRFNEKWVFVVYVLALVGLILVGLVSN